MVALLKDTIAAINYIDYSITAEYKTPEHVHTRFHNSLNLSTMNYSICLRNLNAYSHLIE